jgi:hypothetical protein
VKGDWRIHTKQALPAEEMTTWCRNRVLAASVAVAVVAATAFAVAAAADCDIVLKRSTRTSTVTFTFVAAITKYQRFQTQRTIFTLQCICDVQPTTVCHEPISQLTRIPFADDMHHITVRVRQMSESVRQ